MDDNELEEGEACDDPDSNFDPDTDFSYIDEKLKVVLGDVQKEFEGGVSAEKLGSKFGGYGSFLPTHERTPSLLGQPALASDVSRPKKSPSEGVVERFKRIAVGLSTGPKTEKVYNGAGPLPAEDGSKALGLDSGYKDSGESKLVALENAPKKVTLRITMRSEANARRKNTAIYSGLGLEHSSSASPEDDLEDDQRSVSEIESSPDRSPLSMIQIITSHELPGGFLLSPMSDIVFEQGKVSFISKEVHSITLPVTSKAESAQETFTTRTGLESVRDIGLFNEKKDKVKDRKKEKLSKQRGGSEVNDGCSKNSKRDESVKKSGKESSQSVSKNPAKLSGRESRKLNEVIPETLDRDAVSESGKGLNSRREPQNLRQLTSDRDKDVVSDSGKGMVSSDRNRESVKCSEKHKSSSSECTKKEVKDEPVDCGSPFTSFKDVLSNREMWKVDRRDRGSFQENGKEQFYVSNQAREMGKELVSGGIVEEGKKQKEINRDLPNEVKKLSDGKEAKSLQKEKIMTNKEASKYSSKEKGIGQNAGLETSTADKEHGKDVMGETKRKLKDATKDAHLSREPFKDKEKDSSVETPRDLKRDVNWKQALCKEAVNDGNRERHKDTTKVKDSHKKIMKEATKKENMEVRKKEKIKEGKVGEEKEREREQSSLAKAHVVNALDYLPSERQPETNHADQKPFLGVVAGLPSEGVQAPVVSAPVVILENWVACDKCERWRLLPPGIQPEQLPKTWKCEMLSWLQGMNSCRFTEEETTQALYVLLGIPQPLPQAQADPATGQLQPPAGVTAAIFADSKDVCMPNKLSTKKMGKSEVSSVKSKCLNDVGQLPPEHKVVIGDDSTGYARVLEEKRMLKEKEKLKRLHANDDGDDKRSKKYMVQEESNGVQHGKGSLGGRKDEKFLKHISINSRKSSFDVEPTNVQSQASSIHGDNGVSLMQKRRESDKIEPLASDAVVKVKRTKEGRVNDVEDFQRTKKLKAENHKTVRGTDHSSVNSKIETAEADIPLLQQHTGDGEDRTVLGKVEHGKRTSAIGDVAQVHSSKVVKDIVAPKKSGKKDSCQMIEGAEIEGRGNSLDDKGKGLEGIEGNKKQESDQRERKRKEREKKDARWLDPDPTSRSNHTDGKNIANEEESESEHRKQKRLREKTYVLDRTEVKDDRGRVSKPPLPLSKDTFELERFEGQKKLGYREDKKTKENQSKSVMPKQSGKFQGRMSALLKESPRKDTERSPLNSDILGKKGIPCYSTSSSSFKMSSSPGSLVKVHGSPVESTVSSSPLRSIKVGTVAVRSTSRRESIGADDLLNNSVIGHSRIPERCLDLSSPGRVPQGYRDANGCQAGPTRRSKGSQELLLRSDQGKDLESNFVHGIGRSAVGNVVADGRYNSGGKGREHEDVYHRHKHGISGIDGERCSDEQDENRMSSGDYCLGRDEKAGNERHWEQEGSVDWQKDRGGKDGQNEKQGSRERCGWDGERNHDQEKSHEKGMNESAVDGNDSWHAKERHMWDDLGRSSHFRHLPCDDEFRDNRDVGHDDWTLERADAKERRNNLNYDEMKAVTDVKREAQLRQDYEGNVEPQCCDASLQKMGTVPLKEGITAPPSLFFQSSSRINAWETERSAYVAGGKSVQADVGSSRNSVKPHNISVAVDSLNRIDAQQTSSGGSGGHPRGSQVEVATLDPWVGESSRQCREHGRSAGNSLLGRASNSWSGPHGCAGRDDVGVPASPVRRDHVQIAANNAMREATDLKHHADRLKGKKGKERESTYLYLRAALKFLHAAAMLESVYVDNAKHGEITQSMIVYTDTAKLCEYCAVAFERAKEMAAAALAYKCVGIARMRVVWAKCVCINHDREELQAAHQLAPPGESPSSSSASDVDNLNNQVQNVDKISLVAGKRVSSSSLAAQGTGNFAIPARICQNFSRVLQFVSDVTAALEAFDKSQAAFLTAYASSASATYGVDGIRAVKNVVDFGFYDVENLLQLVRLALEAIGP